MVFEEYCEIQFEPDFDMYWDNPERSIDEQYADELKKRIIDFQESRKRTGNRDDAGVV